jgi:aryl carrier-like protein
MLPSKWATVKDFPLTTNGKIDRKNLPKPQVVVDGNFVAPLTTDESVVLEIAKDVLEIDSIGVETDLLNAGMTSMQVMEFVFRLAEKDYFEITITSVYKNRTIRKLLELKEGKLFFWANEYDPEKPLIVLLCGYPYFSPYYINFIRYFQKDFSIFVFESYHEFFFKKEEISLDVLFDAYTHVLDDILKDKKLFAMTGYCFGSELAIAYANYLLTYKPDMKPPRIINIEGVFERPKGEPVPDVEDARIKENHRISEILTNGLPPLFYSGDIIHFMAGIFSNRIYLEFGEVLDENLLKKVHENMKINWENWKKNYPDSPYYQLDCSHSDFFEEKNLQRIRDAIRLHWNI